MARELGMKLEGIDKKSYHFLWGKSEYIFGCMRWVTNIV